MMAVGMQGNWKLPFGTLLSKGSFQRGNCSLTVGVIVVSLTFDGAVFQISAVNH